MDDLISRQDAIDALRMMQGIVYEDGVRKGISLAWEQISGLPSAQKKGKNISKNGFLCSLCSFGDFFGFHGYEPNFCPNCGSKMLRKESEVDE